MTNKTQSLAQLEAALAAPVEPVAWIIETEKPDGTYYKWVSMDKKRHAEFCDRGSPIPLYAAPVSRVISDAEIADRLDELSTRNEWTCYESDTLGYAAAMVRQIAKAEGK